MKKIVSIISIVLFLNFLFVSCTKKSNSTTASTAYCTALVNGITPINFQAATTVGTKSTNLITILATCADYTTIKFTLPLNVSLKNYSAMDSNISITYYDNNSINSYASGRINCSSGTLSIQTLTANYISGTFSGKLIENANCNNANGYYTVSNGKFACSFQ